MSKAEEKAWEAYPIDPIVLRELRTDYGDLRHAFIEGYHQAEQDLTDKAKVSSGWDGFYYGQGYKQAEKDLELTWEDIERIDDILIRIRLDGTEEAKEMFYKEFYIEVLKQFKERKKK